MIESLINYIQTQIIPLGGFGVFIASIIEEVLAPIPSAMVIFGAGFLLIDGPINAANILDLFLVVALPAALGVTLGSLLVYAIAFYAGKPILTKWGKWLGLSWADVEKLQARFANSSFDEMSLFIIRAIPIVPSVVISAFCGLIRFPLKAYILYSFLGLIVRAALLGVVGWQLGKFYFQYAATISLFENVILIVVAVGVVLFIISRVLKMKPKVSNESGPKFPQDPQ